MWVSTYSVNQFSTEIIQSMIEIVSGIINAFFIAEIKDDIIWHYKLVKWKKSFGQRQWSKMDYYLPFADFGLFVVNTKVDFIFLNDFVGSWIGDCFGNFIHSIINATIRCFWYINITFDSRALRINIDFCKKK